jgi:hypothetical protein
MEAQAAEAGVGAGVGTTGLGDEAGCDLAHVVFRPDEEGRMSDQGEFDKDGHFKTGIGTEHLIVGAQQELADARAQIAAKDAALRTVLKDVLYIHGRGGLGLDVHGVMDGWVSTINEALARETE